MSTSQEAPALIQYACERCKTRFVLPPSRRKLSLGGKIRSLSMGLGRTFRYHEGLGSSYDTARRQLLAKMDDEAYQSFVQSFRFCHECRQFVCNECWSTSRRSCLTCVAKSMTGTARPRPPFAPTGPEVPRPVAAAVGPSRRGRVRRDAALVALGLAIVLVALEGGYLLINSGGAAATPEVIYVTEKPSTSPSATPVATLVVTAAPSASPSPSPSPTASPSPSATATATPTPTPTPVPTPTRKPVTPAPPTPTIPPTLNPYQKPAISCSATLCSWYNPWPGAWTTEWFIDVTSSGSGSTLDISGVVGEHDVSMIATRSGAADVSNPVHIAK